MEPTAFYRAALDHPNLTTSEHKTLSQLINQYEAHLPRNLIRSNYFDGKHTLRKLGLTLPAALANLDTVVGWPTQAVTTLENRLELDGFVRAGQGETDKTIEDLFAQNMMAIDASQAHTAALVHGTSFVAVTGAVEPNDPDAVITVHSALQATGLWDSRHRCLRAGMVVETANKYNPHRLILFTPEATMTFTSTVSNGVEMVRMPHSLGRVPMVALSHRPWLERPFGVSRINRAVMSMTDQAIRCIMRTEAAAEFFSFPQRYILGVSEDEMQNSGWSAYMNRLLAIGRDEDGQMPDVKQLPAQSMQPHIDELRSIAMMFSGETGIPPSYLGIIHDNPASADAIRAAESKLVKIAERDQIIFGARWCEVARLALQVATGEDTRTLTDLQAHWKDASTPTKSAQAQSVMTLVQSGVLPPRSDVTYELLGYDKTTIDRLMADAAHAESNELFKSLASLPTATTPPVKLKSKYRDLDDVV